MLFFGAGVPRTIPASQTSHLPAPMQQYEVHKFTFNPDDTIVSDSEDDPFDSDGCSSSPFDSDSEFDSSASDSDSVTELNFEILKEETKKERALLSEETASIGLVPRRRAGRPRAPDGSAADTARNAQRRRRAVEKRREDRLEADWRAAIAEKDDTKADMLCQDLLSTVRGRALFPSQTKTLSELKAMKKLADNVNELNQDMGPRSKHRKIIATRVTKGLPPNFCEEVLGFNAASLRQFRKQIRDNPSKPALLSEHRNEEKGRVCWSPAFEGEVARFFKSRTEILSGANTHTRKLLMNKGRLEAEFHAELPAILRSAVRHDPDMRPNTKKPNRILTEMEKNTLAAEYAADQPGFAQADEYSRRLDAELQRYVRFCGFQQMCHPLDG